MRLDKPNREILRIAVPAIVSNITVPLLGLVDTAIAGHMGDASYIGAIAVGGVVFNAVFWLFSFLRWGTSGLTAQALGACDNAEISNSLYRSCLLASVVGMGLILLQSPLYFLATRVITVSDDVAIYTSQYFHVCIWGAFAVQMCYALTGWFIGMQNSRIPMVVAIVQNVTNIPLSLFFVYGLGMKIVGIALGTVIAQYVGLLVAVAMLFISYRRYLVRPDWGTVFQRSALMRFLSVNRDIMLRLVCLLAVTMWFTAAGARQGGLVLAANAMLYQLFYLFSFFFDGFANAGEALCGRCWGAKDLPALRLTIRRVFCWGLVLVGVFTALYLTLGEQFLWLLSDRPEVVETAMEYFVWVLFVPVCGIQTFVWDGVFIGVTATRLLLLAMAVGTAVFFVSYLTLFPLLGNDGLWISFLLYLLGRGVTETLCRRKALGGAKF